MAAKLDYWRNYVGIAPDIEITTLPGVAEHLIDLSPWLVQGAKYLGPATISLTLGAQPVAKTVLDKNYGVSPTPDILTKIPVQRGWVMSIVLRSNPKHGIARVDPQHRGIWYRPTIDSSPDVSDATPIIQIQDCFGYCLSNGTQFTGNGKITVNMDVTKRRP